MKTKKLLLIALSVLTSIMFWGCQKKPTATFVSSTGSPKTGEAVRFSNTSSDGNNYEWDFGDGQNSTETSPSHIYTSGGSRTVKLTAFSKNGRKSSSATLSINVSAYGRVTFWQSGIPSYGNTDVTITSVTQTITVNSSSPSCGASGCANFGGTPGIYNYTAAEQFPGTATWSGAITITDNGCSTLELY